MKVLIDTCVWSKVLRQKKPDLELTQKVKDLIDDGRVSIIGPIRQDLLSGISDTKQFNQLKSVFAAHEDIPLTTDHFAYALH